MNRLEPAMRDVPRPPAPETSLAWGRIGVVEQDAPCAIFSPMHYEQNYAYPLLVWLHGPSDDESQLKRIMPLVSMRNYAAVAPRGTRANAHPSGVRERFSWRQTEADIALAESRVFDCLALARERFNIAEQRVFLAGFDCGGTMAFRLAMNHPDTFAGVLSLGGEFPRHGSPLVRLNQAREMPVLLACGSASVAYPPEQVCDDLRLLHSAGIDIVLRQYSCGQEISPAMLADMDRWMMEQILG